MSTDRRLNDDDADRMRDFADRCRRVAGTALRVAEAETPEGAELLSVVVSAAEALRVALLAAARYADPEGDADEH